MVQILVEIEGTKREDAKRKTRQHTSNT